MRLRTRTIVMAALLGVLWGVPSPSSAQVVTETAPGPCDKEAATVAEKGATMAKASKAVDEANTAVRDMLLTIAGAERALASHQAAEQQAFNAWNGATAQLLACFSKPRDNECTAEQQAVNRATARLNEKKNARQYTEKNVNGFKESLVRLRAAVDTAMETWSAAFKAWEAAKEDLAACLKKARTGGENPPHPA